MGRLSAKVVCIPNNPDVLRKVTITHAHTHAHGERKSSKYVLTGREGGGRGWGVQLQLMPLISVVGRQRYL